MIRLRELFNVPEASFSPGYYLEPVSICHNDLLASRGEEASCRWGGRFPNLETDLCWRTPLAQQRGRIPPDL